MHEREAWRDHGQLPNFQEKFWAIWQNGRQKPLDFSEVVDLTRKWTPANGLLVGEPGRNNFVPPISVKSLEAVALASVARYFRALVFLWSICALVILSVGVINLSSKAVLTGLLFGSVALVLFLDFHFSLRVNRGVEERALYFHWMKKSGSFARKGGAFWIYSVLFLAVTQILLIQKHESLTAVFHAYGVMYSDVRAGEIWRLVTGPYFHYSTLHFLINSSMLLVVGPIAFSSFGWFSVFMFTAGNIASAAAQMWLGGAAFDSFGGISGGVYSLFGGLLAVGFRRRELLPSGLPLLFMGLSVVGIVSAEVFSEKSATSAHVVGLWVGIVLGLLNLFFIRRFEESSSQSRSTRR